MLANIFFSNLNSKHNHCKCSKLCPVLIEYEKFLSSWLSILVMFVLLVMFIPLIKDPCFRHKVRCSYGWTKCYVMGISHAVYTRLTSGASKGKHILKCYFSRSSNQLNKQVLSIKNNDKHLKNELKKPSSAPVAAGTSKTDNKKTFRDILPFSR